MKKQDYTKPYENPLMFICAASLGVAVQVLKKNTIMFICAASLGVVYRLKKTKDTMFDAGLCVGVQTYILKSTKYTK